MVPSFPPDIQTLISQHMASGQFASEEDLLRFALQSLEEEDESEAIRAAIDAWQAGDEGLPLDEAFNAVRRRHGLDPRP